MYKRQAVDDAKLTNVNTPVSGTVAANDYDPDNNVPLSYAKVTNPLHGTVTLNTDGTYTYTPTSGYIGNDSFTYKVCDSGSPSTVSYTHLDVYKRQEFYHWPHKPQKQIQTLRLRRRINQ